MCRLDSNYMFKADYVQVYSSMAPSLTHRVGCAACQIGSVESDLAGQARYLSNISTQSCIILWHLLDGNVADFSAMFFRAACICDVALTPNLRHAVLCVLCYDMLCYAMLYCAVPCCAVPCCAVPCRAVLCYAILCYAMHATICKS